MTSSFAVKRKSSMSPISEARKSPPPNEYTDVDVSPYGKGVTASGGNPFMSSGNKDKVYPKFITALCALSRASFWRHHMSLTSRIETQKKLSVLRTGRMHVDCNDFCHRLFISLLGELLMTSCTVLEELAVSQKIGVVCWVLLQI